MKNIYIFIVVVIITLSSCKAQNAPLYRADLDLPTGTHFKDFDNDLTDFVGTWKCQKWEDVFFEDTNQYEDMLVGAYKFDVNGSEIQNNLTQLNDQSIYIHDHYLSGNTILHRGQYPKCEDCSDDQRQVFVYFTDQQREYLNSAMVLRHRVENGIEKMQVVFYSFNYTVIPTTDSPTENRIPYGDYTFIKQ